MNKPKTRNLRSLMREDSADFDPVPARQSAPDVPDVPGLVGRMRILVAAGNRLNAEAEECTYDGNTAEVAGSEYWCEFRDALEAATEALAAHRKQQENK